MLHKLPDGELIARFRKGSHNERNEILLALYDRLNQNNVDFAVQTYQHLADAAEKKVSADLALKYREKALEIQGWAQDNFPA
jgi:hypothetical protein